MGLLGLFCGKNAYPAVFCPFVKKFNEITARIAGFCKEKSREMMTFVGATLCGCPFFSVAQVRATT